MPVFPSPSVICNCIAMNTIKLPFYARLAFILLSLVLTLFLLEQGRDIFIPLVFGLLIAILLYPVNKFFEQRLKMGRGLSAMLCIVIFMAALFGFSYLLVQQIANFTDDFPELKGRFNLMFSDLQHWISVKFHIYKSQQAGYINKSINSMVESGARAARDFVASIASLVLLLVFVFIFSFFMLFHRRLLMQFVLHLFSKEYRPQVSEVVQETKVMINSYVLGLMIEMLLISVVACSMLLIMGIKYALLLGLMAAVLNIIPYIGIYTCIALTMLVTFANSGTNTAIEAGAGMFVIHLLDSNILMPRIVGARVKMNPFITIVAVIVGEYIWGIPGMFLFIPIAGIIKLICDRVEGMEAWGMLIGVEEVEKKPKHKITKAMEDAPADGSTDAPAPKE